MFAVQSLQRPWRLHRQLSWRPLSLLPVGLALWELVRYLQHPTIIYLLNYAGFDSSADLKLTLQSIRATLKLPADVPVPVGVGFIGWMLDNTESSGDPRIIPVLDELPTAVWFAFGNDLGKYIAQVRAYDAKRAHKTIVFIIVNSVADALRAANEWKVDVLVVQGK